MLTQMLAWPESAMLTQMLAWPVSDADSDACRRQTAFENSIAMPESRLNAWQNKIEPKTLPVPGCPRRQAFTTQQDNSVGRQRPHCEAAQGP